jgi:dTDP-4-dehydrorhamnose 3,5-epimerase
VPRVEATRLPGVKLLTPESFEDHRGEYVETYNEQAYRAAGIEVRFVQDDYSWSVRHVLRGLHGDAKTWKLVFCPHGRFYLVVLCCDERSPDYGKWESFVLSDRNKKQVLIPPGYGTGHLVLSARAVFAYKQSEYYDPRSQFSLRWDDPRFGIWWPVRDPMLSRRDELGRYMDPA